MDSPEKQTATLEGGQPPTSLQPFSIFTKAEKTWISSVAAVGAMFSTLSSYIYIPALVPIARDLNVSVTLINLTVTSYMVIAGIAPAFMGDLADQGGRRPAYMFMFTLALGSAIGLAVQDSYPVLLVLRMVQSAGISGSYGAAYGIIADITTVSERGSFTGSLILFTNSAPSFGPVVAGVMAQRHGWRSIFWFLVALTGSYLAVVVLLLPETQRKLVGNGRVPAKRLHRSLFDRFIRDRVVQGVEQPARKSFHVPNPFKCIVLLASKGNFAIISIGSITYAVKMMLQTSLAAQCIEVYNLNYLQAGLIYLPSGAGGAIASYITGKVLDRNIKKATRHRETGFARDDIADFPIEDVRFQGIYGLILISAASTAGYGVSLGQETASRDLPKNLEPADQNQHLAVPLLMQFVSGAATSSIFTLCGTLLTDLNPGLSATVQASYNLVRCLGAGAAVAVQQPLAEGAGPSWCFGTFAVVMLLAAPMAAAVRRWGLVWRRKGASG